MEIRQILKSVTDELAGCFEQLEEGQLKKLEKEITDAERIFVAGAGRSLLMVRGLAMRLMHMGYTAYVVGETVTPAISSKDLLIIASGSGSTATMAVMAKKCREIGARLALITTRVDSPIGRLADVIIEVKTGSSKTEHNAYTTIQPGGNTFEQSVLLIGDAIVIDLVSTKSLDESNAELMSRHANLE